jgi:hypothetical protein
MMNKWFTRHLYGIQNNVERDPRRGSSEKVRRVQRVVGPARGERARTIDAADAGTPTIRISRLRPTLHPGPAARAGTLVLTAPSKAGTEKLVDNVELVARCSRKRRSRRIV